MYQRFKKFFVRYLFITLLTLLFLCVSYASQNELRVTFMDVGQADSILVQTPNNMNILIDTGNRDDFATISKYLKENDIKRLDVVIGTHPHEDHIGSMAEVIKKFDIGEIYMPKISTNTKTFENVLLAIKERGLKISPARAGIHIDLATDIKLEFLAPNNSTYENLNDYSGVVKLTYNKESFLFTGDAGIASEMEMINKNYNLKASFLKVGHHGSRTSTSDLFLKKVSPRYAVISVGLDNKYGHPTVDTLNRLNNANIKIYRTDFDGTITATSDGETIKIDKHASPIKPNAPPISSSTIKPLKSDQSDNISVTVYITRTGLKYHRAGCRYLSRSSISIDLNEAKTGGYSPCSVCNPPQ